MEENNKLVIFFKKITDSEVSLKRIPFYFFLICVLLVVIIFKLEKTNKYLQIIAENETNIIEYETQKNEYFEIITEENKKIEDYVPLLEEVTDETTTIKQSGNSIETTTKTHTENSSSTTTTTENNTSKTIYVLNISSKKIHLADCSFVSRTKEENKKTVTLSDDELNKYLNDGYTLCKTCGGN